MAINPPKNPEYFYKFRGVSNLRWLIDILLRKRLYAAAYDELNDPMEGFFLFDPSTDVKTREELRDKRKLTAICSLSKDYRNTLMWSFYAEDHKGICIKLAVTSSNWNKTELKYDNKLPIMTKDPEAYIKLLSQKSEHWAHEEEVRYIRVFKNQKQMGQSRYVHIYIDKIYLGYKMSTKDVSFYTNLFKTLLPYLTNEKIQQLKIRDINTGFNNV